MARFKFPLQAALKQRKIKEELAQKDYGDAIVILRQSEQRLAELLQLESESRQRASEVQSRGGTEAPAALKQIHDFITLNLRRIQHQKLVIKENEKLVEVKQEILRQAAIEHKIMVRLKEKRFEEFKHEQGILEQKEMDELSILRFETNSEDQ